MERTEEGARDERGLGLDDDGAVAATERERRKTA